MSLVLDEPRRVCERLCTECKRWKHYSRFRSWQDKRPGRNGTVSAFSPVCRACEQIARDVRKNTDRPRAIIEQRAAAAATRAGVSKKFFMEQMNYRALIPIMRALMSDEGRCLDCGHRFVNERDIQIEHWYPPRATQDWALLHTRNLGFACGSCNGVKGKKPPLQWLDEQEDARLSNLQQPCIEPAAYPPVPVQFTLELGL